MRFHLQVVALCPLPALGACDVPCEAAAELEASPWRVFANLRDFELENRARFPASSSPANGEHELALAFAAPGMAGAGATVEIDGQAFEGAATFAERTCGGLDLSWSGTYYADVEQGDEGAAHTFEASGTFLVAEGRLEGVVDYAEDWSVGTGDTAPTGSVTGEALFRGGAVE